MNSEEFGLSEEILNKIKKVFLAHKEIEKVALIGSRAKGSYQKGSDVDLVVWGSDLKFSDYLRIIAELEELDIPYKIDLLKYDLISNVDLKEHIERVGRVIYVREKITR